jgi:hypothetical protein
MEPQTWTGSLDKQPKLRKIDMMFSTWNVKSFYRAGSLMTVAKELSKYMSDFVGAQNERRDRSGTEPVGESTFFYGNGNENHELRTVSFVHKIIILVVKRVESIIGCRT